MALKARQIGIRFDRWQADTGMAILAKTDDGRYATTVGGVILSWPRQVGKTFLIGAILFCLCLLNPDSLVLWTSHALRTTNETFRSMQKFSRNPLIKPFIAAVRRGSGDLGIEFTNGSRILFGAREQGFGLGFAKVDVLVFDEAQRLTDKALDDMLPAQNAAANPLYFLIGTPPRPTDSGEVFTRIRADALAGEARDLLYIEFSADKSARSDGVIDWEQVGKANPSYPRRTPQSSIMRLLRRLGMGSLRREVYGIWDDESGPPLLVSKDDWTARKADDPIPALGGVAVGIKFSLDGTRVAACAARKPDSHGPHVETLGEWPITEGLGILETLLTTQWRKLGMIVIDGKAGRDVLAPALLRARIPQRLVILPTVDQVIAANATYLTSIEDATLTHANQPGLNASMASVTKRKIGTAGGWGMEPIGEGDEVPAEAAALAVWGTTKVRKPAAMPRRLY